MGNSESTLILNEIQQRSGYWFKNQQLLNESLTHTSIRASDPNSPTFRRLEHFGDSVLQLVITEYLFLQYPNKDQGFLSSTRSNYVSSTKLNQIADELKIERLVTIADSVKKQRQDYSYRNYGDFVEAYIGAVFVDAGYGSYGYNAAKTVIFNFWKLKPPVESGCTIA